ncbi:hypothetical protein [Marinobacter sp. OP 3.4]|uniref:hypothetical protein n=1 Tax=Marinobacter sp. OP 3.4 TaxID=3076501 RepID=UPI002E1E6588
MIDVTKDYDPRYVQVRRQRAAEILGVSPSELDRLRKDDPDCPQGFKHSDARNSPVMFRLSDLYAYSEKRMQAAHKAA